MLGVSLRHLRDDFFLVFGRFLLASLRDAGDRLLYFLELVRQPIVHLVLHAVFLGEDHFGLHEPRF